MDEAQKVRVAKIAVLNDQLRKNYEHVVATKGVIDLLDSPLRLKLLMIAIAGFSNFTEDNDPYGEHDFGSIVWCSIKFFWKIDYYDKVLKVWCDPLDPSCRRVMTVMLASEY